MRYSKEFKEIAVKKVLQMKETQSMVTIARELNVSKATLYAWVENSSNNKATDEVITLAKKLQILQESYGMKAEELSAYCREKGIFTHQLKAWEQDFLKTNNSQDSNTKKALKEEKSKNKALAKELQRKEKALAETATLLVLQKKFQALLEDEGV